MAAKKRSVGWLLGIALFVHRGVTGKSSGEVTINVNEESNVIGDGGATV
jgi:hypothetical protein